jgi:NADH dehydrogenase/NADH:ubiquinone oxidoreductase subunit G
LLDRHDFRCGACAKKDTCLLLFLMRTFKARKKTPNPSATAVVTTDHIAFYPERCVLCGRCVALSRQRGSGLCFHHRGGKTQVAPPWGQTWEQATDNLAQDLIDICPVGALCHPKTDTK